MSKILPLVNARWCALNEAEGGAPPARNEEVPNFLRDWLPRHYTRAYTRGGLTPLPVRKKSVSIIHLDPAQKVAGKTDVERFLGRYYLLPTLSDFGMPPVLRNKIFTARSRPLVVVLDTAGLDHFQELELDPGRAREPFPVGCMVLQTVARDYRCDVIVAPSKVKVLSMHAILPGGKLQKTDDAAGLYADGFTPLAPDELEALLARLKKLA